MKTPSAWAPAAFNERGCEAARKTGLGRFTHGRWAVPPRYEAGRPRRSSLTHATPSASSLAGRLGAPRLRVPLWPTPMPSTARPGASRSTDAIDAAATAGWRVTRLVTQTATRARRVPSASNVVATQGSIAMPGGLGTVLLPFSGVIRPQGRARTRDGRFA